MCRFLVAFFYFWGAKTPHKTRPRALYYRGRVGCGALLRVLLRSATPCDALRVLLRAAIKYPLYPGHVPATIPGYPGARWAAGPATRVAVHVKR